MRKYYVYAWLREDGTPYYIGKGTGRRAYRHRRDGWAQRPDRSRIVLLHENLTEEEALERERELITEHGRKCNGTGILHNQQEGGTQPPDATGRRHSEETKKKMGVSQRKAKANLSEETRQKMSESAKRRANSPEGREILRQNGVKTSSQIRGEGGKFTRQQKHC